MPFATRFIEDVPRGINLAKGICPWSCHCGQHDNWLCRPRCKNCGREQPASIAAEARRVAARTRREREQPKQDRGRSRERARGRSRSESRGRSKSRGGAGGRGAAAGDGKKGGGARGKGGGGGGGHPQRTYADVATKNEADLRKQLAAEKREKEELARRLAAATSSAAEAQAAANDGGNGPPGATSDGDDDADAEAARDQRLQQLATAIEALEAVGPADDAKLLQLQGEREALLKAKRECKPLKAQLLAVDRKLDKKRAAIKRLEARKSEAWNEVERVRKEAEALDDEHAAMEKALDELEAEKRDMLRRELDGEVGSIKADNAHWDGTVDAIRTRLLLPGTPPELAHAIGASLEQLRLLCTNLPQAVPAAAGATSTSASSSSSSSPAAAAATAAACGAATARTEAGGGTGGGGCNNGGGGQGATTGGNSSTSSGILAGPPAVLGPHGTAAAATPPAVVPQPATPIAAAPPTAGPLETGRAINLDTQAAADITVPNGEDAAGASGDGSAQGAADDMDVDVVLQHLSPYKRRKFLASLRGSAVEQSDGGRDRERSPRNTKKEDATL